MVSGEGSSQMKPSMGSLPSPCKLWSEWGFLLSIQASYPHYWHWCYMEIAELSRSKAFLEMCMVHKVLTIKGRSKMYSWFFLCCVAWYLKLSGESILLDAAFPLGVFLMWCKRTKWAAVPRSCAAQTRSEQTFISEVSPVDRSLSGVVGRLLIVLQMSRWKKNQNP